MSLFVLDTDTLTLLQRRHPMVCERAAAHATETAITVLTVEEQLSGWYGVLRKARKPDRIIEAYRSLAENVRFLSQLRILDYDQSALSRYEEVKRQKLNIGKFGSQQWRCITVPSWSLATCGISSGFQVCRSKTGRDDAALRRLNWSKIR